MNNSLSKVAYSIAFLCSWFGILLTLYTIITHPAPIYPLDMMIANFFSYFTIQSNIIVALVATSWLFNKNLFGRFQRLFELGGLINITITFFVVYFVLSKLQVLEGINLIADNFVHVYTPIVYVLVWLVFRAKKKYSFKTMLKWLVYPIGYFVYSIIRGAIVGWYPYPFINASVLSVGELLMNVVLLTLAFVFVGSIFVFISNKMSK